MQRSRISRAGAKEIGYLRTLRKKYEEVLPPAVLGALEEALYYYDRADMDNDYYSEALDWYYELADTETDLLGELRSFYSEVARIGPQ